VQILALFGVRGWLRETSLTSSSGAFCQAEHRGQTVFLQIVIVVVGLGLSSVWLVAVTEGGPLFMLPSRPSIACSQWMELFLVLVRKLLQLVSDTVLSLGSRMTIGDYRDLI